MLSNIAIGAILILLTTAVHAGGMSLSLRSISSRSTTAGSGLHQSRVFSVGRVVLIMYLIAIIEVLIWAAAYLAFDMIEGFERIREGGLFFGSHFHYAGIWRCGS